jgi:hypothetical protein
MSAPVRGGTTVEAATCTAASGEAEGPVRGAVASFAARWGEPRSMEERHYSWLEDHLARLGAKRRAVSTTRG